MRTDRRLGRVTEPRTDLERVKSRHEAEAARPGRISGTTHERYVIPAYCAPLRSPCFGAL